MSTYMGYFVAIVIMAVVTYITRALPLALFNRQVKSRFVRSFLHYVPYAVLASLTFPSIFYCTSNTLAAVVGTIVALVLAYMEKSLVVVAVAAVLTMFIVGLF